MTWEDRVMQVDVSTLSASDLELAYRAPLARWVRANMVVSLDGNYVGPNGTSRDLSSPADLRVLLLLRAISDVVVVGARTATSEKYSTMRVRPDFESLSTRPTKLCIVSNSLELDDVALGKISHEEPIIFTRRQETVRWEHRYKRVAKYAQLIVSESTLDGATIITQLHELGFGQILCEGGPSLLALFAKDKVFDELAVTLAPIVVGQHVAQPPFGLTTSTWHRTLVGTAQDHTFFRFTATPLQNLS